MKKTKLKVILSIFSIGTLIAFLIFSNFVNKRSKYESFLLSDIKSLNESYNSEIAPKIMMDKPEMAGIQDYYATIDPTLKKVPHERLISAIQETQSKLKRSKSELFDRYQWNEVPSNMSGRVRSFMIDPNDIKGEKVWAGSVTGGLWYNNNIYENDSIWHPVSDVWENLSISSIIADPNNPQIFYVGTGEAQTAVTIYRESSTRGVGIWKTTDAGKTWTLLPSTSNFNYITDIVVKNESANSVIYAGVVSGTYQGENHLSNPSDGVYRSTDGGSTWTQVLPNIAGETVPYSPSDLEIAASGRIFVGTYRNIDGKGGATILHSDDGISWSVYDEYNSIISSSEIFTNNIPGRTMLASAPSNPNTIYAIIAAGRTTPENWIYYRGKHLIKSTDNGENWIEKTVPNGDPEETYWATLAWHALTIKVDPNNENTLYAGGLNMQKSTDGGNTWDLKSFWYNRTNYPPYLHADQHNITFKPNSSDTIFFTNDGGVFATFNGSNSNITYIEKNNSLNTLQFYTCNLHPDSAALEYIGGLQDNGTVLFTGNPINKNESPVSGGDGAYCFFDNDDFLISTVYYNSIYIANKVNGTYQRLDQNGDFYGTGTFICPSDYDDNHNTFYANAVGFTGARANSILRVTNMTTVNSSGIILDVNTNSSVPFSHVKYSQYSPYNAANLYLGTQSGKLYKTLNAHSSPSSTEIGSNQFPTANISCVAEGKDENELLVTFSNYGVSSIWYSGDGGSNWEEKEGNLPDMPIRWALFDPVDTAKVLLATEVGVWGTNNIYSDPVNWEPINNNFPNVRVDMLRLRTTDNTILAATHGRGLFYCDLEGGKPSTTSIFKHTITEFETKIYPNPTNGYINLNFAENVNGLINISVFDESGRMIKSIKSNINSNQFNFNISEFNNGIYFINISANKKFVTKKVILRK